VSDEAFDRDRNATDPVSLLGRHAPPHGRHVRRNAAVHILLEVRDDLPPPLLPPHPRRRHTPAVLQDQRIGQVRVRIRERLVVVRVIRRVLIAARAGAERLDAEEVHHAPMILLGGERDRRRYVRCGCADHRRRAADHRSERDEPREGGSRRRTLQASPAASGGVVTSWPHSQLPPRSAERDRCATSESTASRKPVRTGARAREGFVPVPKPSRANRGRPGRAAPGWTRWPSRDLAPRPERPDVLGGWAVTGAPSSTRGCEPTAR
jgi:hypothetical protein